jgi:pyroglutamyl-peptidase
VSLYCTAFVPFGGRPVNRSAVVLAELQALGVPGELLPVTFAGVAARVPALCHDHDCLLMLGENSSDDRLAIEHVALNVADGGRSDEGHARLHGTPLVVGASLALRAELAPQLLHACAELAARASWHAGTFVCNAAFFHALHAGARAAFVHVPARPRLGDPAPSRIAQVLLAAMIRSATPLDV